MKRKQLWILSGTAAISALALTAVVLSHGTFDQYLAKAGLEHKLTLNADTVLTEQDHGFYHSAEDKGNEFDFLGYSPVEGKLGNIKKKNYNGVYDYVGMVYNRAAINGFNSLTVTFSGANLYYSFTPYLMQDMSFDKSHQAISGEAILAGSSDAYFVLYTDDATTGVDIDDIVVDLECDGSVDGTLVFNKASTLGNARSAPKSFTLHDNYIEMANKPTATTNNYSTGKTGTNDNTWYRWSGKRFDNSAVLGNEFSLNFTILGNISQAVNYYENAEDNYFHYSVWPKICAEGDTETYNWGMFYIGNDNYEPLGKDNPDRVHKDLYGNYSYAGRFFTQYKDYGTDGWQFADPDTTNVLDGTERTLRQAYEAYTLPYWYLKYDFHIEKDGGSKDEIRLDIYVNNIHVSTESFFDSDEFTGQNFYVQQFHMHAVNYGKTDGTPAASYPGVFTYPRLG
ncbi:MAG: hypothetical protein K6E59_01115 [Bacilli bacterium]|nr:hypothetical protein [Bacilli bacterium]